MKYLITFTITDYQRSRRTALVLADSKGQAFRVLTQHLDLLQLDGTSSIEYKRTDTLTTMLSMKSPAVLANIY